MQRTVTTASTPTEPVSRIGGRLRIAMLVDRLTDMCDSMAPGDRLPTHTELMRTLQAPERAVLTALKELHRLGRVERIHGSGTYVTDGSRIRKAFVHQEVSARTIVALARPDHSYFDRSLERLSSHVSVASHDLVIRPVPAEKKLDELANSLQSAEGFIVFGHFLTDLARILIDRGERVVSVGTPITGAYVDVPTVYCDQQAGGYAVASHLLGLGHLNIAFVHDKPEVLRETMRWFGHMQAIVEAQRSGLRVKSSIIDREAYARLDSDSAIAKEFFTGPDATTAVAAWNDVEAIRMLSFFSRHGISAPDQVSVVGYDSTEHSAITHPSLTTVDNAMDQQLRAAVDLLTRPAAPPRGYTVVLHPQLIARESTGRAL